LKTVLFLCTGNYFRSRFAELLFNRLAADAGLDARAVSAGLADQCHTRNPGPISPHTLAGLRARGIEVEAALRGPCDVSEADLASATVVIAVKEAEHRPMVRKRFPTWSDRIRYWDVDDVPQVPAADALARLEILVRELVTELG
jgi:protein-tyrosine phosphatase